MQLVAPLGHHMLDSAQQNVPQLQERDAAGPGTRGPEVNTALWMLTCISALFLSLRLYCKSYRHKDLWWDDWILILSWILLLANSITMTLSVSLGFGMHLLEIEFDNREKLLLLGSLSTTFSTLSAVWSKSSFGLTLLRLTQAGYEKTRALVWVIMVSMNILMSCDALYSWVECQPSRRHWEIFTDGTCWSPDIAVRFGIAAGAYSGCMDVVMAVLPWRIIWETRMERREKIGVLVAMSMGLCAGAAAFAKCSQIPQISLFDETYTGASLVILGAAEPAVTIVGASIPALRVLLTDFKRFTQRRLSDQSESQGSNFDFWDDTSGQRRWSLFRWNGFGGSDSAKPSNMTGTTSTTITSCADPLALPLPAPMGNAARHWKTDTAGLSPKLNHEMFDISLSDTSGDQIPKTSASVPRVCRPAAPSHIYPNLSQQLEDFLWSRKNSYAGTLGESIYDGDEKPVVETMAGNMNGTRAAKKRLAHGRPRFITRNLKDFGSGDSDVDTWSLNSALEDGQGGKASSLCYGAAGQFVVVQTTEITVEFE
ncbi:hypothetical protein KVR01_007414 [Diaporthe batatas]|uniref:uncharacterized protein n=1 Tax=Diaporthe batatas TaxID=748121 RepID=UPI001D037820|nr:uncharacterized protein KVR01_007414 [Diaporthe batatas]KAG8162936.1 hypothetical protein KVR01_007414 [Diaporthe batatas]